MNNYRAHYFPTFNFKPKSIKSTLRFRNPIESLGSIMLLFVWLAGAAIGYILCGALFIAQVIIWVIGKLGTAVFSFNLGKFIALCFGLLIMLLLINM